MAQHAVFTGPVKRDFTLKDGTVVDGRPDVVYVDTLEQAQELADLIGQHYAAHGHSAFDDGDKFTYDAKLSKANFRAHAQAMNGESE